MSDEMQRASERPETQVSPQQAPAEDLVKLIGPFFKHHTESQERQQQRAVALEQSRIEAREKQSKRITYSILVCVIAILFMAGVLFWTGRDDSAFELIVFVGAVVTSFLGGYGFGLSRR